MRADRLVVSTQHKCAMGYGTVWTGQTSSTVVRMSNFTNTVDVELEELYIDILRRSLNVFHFYRLCQAPQPGRR